MQRLLAHLALLVVAVIYGCNYLVAKGLMRLVGPSGFIVLRVIGGGGLFWLVRAAMRARGIRSPSNAAISCGCSLVVPRGWRPTSCCFSMG